MKVLDRLISFIFSLIILVIAVALLLVVNGYADYAVISDTIDTYVVSGVYKSIVNIVLIVLIVLALKTTIFSSYLRPKEKASIMVDTAHGRVEIAQETINNTVKMVASSFEDVKDVQSKMINKNKGIKVYVTVYVSTNTNIKDLTINLQEKIKEVIDRTTGIVVIATDIKVKNVYEKNTKVSAKTDEEKVEPVEEVETVEEKKEEPTVTEAVEEKK